MTESEKTKFSMLFINADEDVRNLVEQILKATSQPSESPD